MNPRRMGRIAVDDVISHIQFTPCSDAFASDGLLGFVRFQIAGLFFADGIAVRRTRDARIALKFPNKKARDGRHHTYLRPIDNAARAEIERFVIARLREAGACPSVPEMETSP